MNSYQDPLLRPKTAEISLESNTAGIISPNPFWLASAPPTNTGDQIMRAFDRGWGGAVWKTLATPVQNVSSRFGALNIQGVRAAGFNNIELISDRTLEANLREIADVKRRYPKHAVIVSIMMDTRGEWHDVVKRAIDTGADGLELNFGCPHGMCERGMGSAVGQDERATETITSWVREVATIPTLVKLTPNTDDIVRMGMAAKRGGADGVSLINTINSVMGVDLDTMTITPSVADRGTHGGYCGAAVKPIALYMVTELSQARQFNLPISGIGGITNWRDAAEFMALGARSVQVATEVMLRGFGVIDDMVSGLRNFMAERGMRSLDDLIGKALPSYSAWGDLDMNYETVARINPDMCIGCNLCVVACDDGAHQCIHPQEDTIVPKVDEDECVGCNLCQITCPVPGCITMEPVDNGYAPTTWNESLVGLGTLRPKKGVPD